MSDHTPNGGGETDVHPDPSTPVDPSASTGATTAKKPGPRGRLRARWDRWGWVQRTLVLVVIVFLLVVGIGALIEKYQGAGRPAEHPADTSTGQTLPPPLAGLSPAATTAINYLTYSYAAEVDKACQLYADPSTCRTGFDATPRAYTFTKEPSFVREESFPAQGVAGQAYTGVLVSYQQTGAKPALQAFLIDSRTKVAGQESVTDRNSRDSLYSILSRDMK